MTRRHHVVLGVAIASAFALTACSGGGSAPVDPDAPVTLTMSGWSLDTTPEFQALADGFIADNPNVEIQLVSYDAAQYNTLLTADLAARSGPDIITQKEVKFVSTFQEGNQLLDVSDIDLPADLPGLEPYEIDGATWAVPYRQDSWVLFYNRSLFDQAGVDYPDGSWTWDDYREAAADITDATDARGAYLHNWQSAVQSFATSQSGGDLLSGDYAYMAPYYNYVLDMQEAGLQVDFNTSSANQLTYQGEFGTQNAAMMMMGTWYVATLIAQQAAGEAQDFEWGMAPVPQRDASTAGLDNVPVTFGDPTAFAINAAIDDSKVEVAKDFLAYAASEDAAQVLAGIGISPAQVTPEVTDVYFSADGAPTDDLSRFTFETHDTQPENPTSSQTAAIQNVLLDMHSAILSGSQSVESAIRDAEARVSNEVGVR